MNEIEGYINQFQEPVKNQLEMLYSYLQSLLPQAEEAISYKMPCFKMNGKAFVYFAGYKNHIGFYPTAKPIVHFQSQLKNFTYSKGAIQFPINSPLPELLIKEIIDFNINSIKISE